MSAVHDVVQLFLWLREAIIPPKVFVRPCESLPYPGRSTLTQYTSHLGFIQARAPLAVQGHNTELISMYEHV